MGEVQKAIGVFLAAHRAEHVGAFGLPDHVLFLAAHRAEHHPAIQLAQAAHFLAAHRAEHSR